MTILDLISYKQEFIAACGSWELQPLFWYIDLKIKFGGYRKWLALLFFGFINYTEYISIFRVIKDYGLSDRRDYIINFRR